MEPGERLGLIGRNGTGKSSLLGAIAGRVDLDDGELRIRDSLRIAMVEQEPVLLPSPSVKESLLGRATVRQEHKLNEFLHRFGVNPEADPTTLSGGESKRAALALAFASEPDLLLLDEPTNHLDIDAIVQLENFLLKQPSAIVVTHDRAFLDRVATRIIELDRGQLFSFAGNFSYYEQAKAAQLASDAVAQRKFDKFWAEEETWIRKGVQARNVRNQGRVRRLERLRDERSARRERVGNVAMSVGSTQR
jgi:ATP-binding cassette subfamily F protein uup